MYFVNCGYPVAVVIYCVAVVLVTINGQPTTDNSEKDEISQLRADLANLKRQLLVDKTANLEGQLAVLSRKLDQGKFSAMTAFVGLHLLRPLSEKCMA